MVSTVAILDTNTEKQYAQEVRYFKVVVLEDFVVKSLYVAPETKLSIDLFNYIGTCKANNVVVNFVNFSLKDGKIVDDKGKFERLTPKNGVVPIILVAEYVTEERVIGYLCIDSTGKLHKFKKADLINLCLKARASGGVLIQNAILKTVGDSTFLSAYASAYFQKQLRSLNKKVELPKLAPHIKETSKGVKTKVSAPTRESVNRVLKKESKPADRYSEDQKKELIAAKKNGIDPMIISDPSLTPEKMRVIWSAKKNGRVAEFFANPALSVDQMQFFADRFTDRKIAKDCRAIISPDYSVEQLSELYLGIFDGLDYSQYLDKNMSAENMYIERNKLLHETFTESFTSNFGDSNGSVFLSRLKGKEDVRHSAE